MDYFSGTTWHFERYKSLVMDIWPEGESGKRSSFLQYKGNRAGGIFHGQGEQNGRTSYYVQVDGASADDNRAALCHSQLKVKRVDIQFTLPKEEWFNSLQVHDDMLLGVWPSSKRQIRAILNEGDDTIYIGDRTHDRFIRIYVKERDFVRFELELKEERAVNAIKFIASGGVSAMAGILIAEIGKLPNSELTNFYRERLFEMTDVAINLTVPKRRPDQMKRLKWLSSLLPTIERMMMDSDYGDIVTGWFVDLVDKKLNKGQL